jgi:excisionase family DNA binding protein
METLEPQVERFLDCTAAAGILGGVHPKTVERWAREGRIPAYRYFRHWRFRASELELWMRSQVNSIRHPCRLIQEKSDGT